MQFFRLNAAGLKHLKEVCDTLNLDFKTELKSINRDLEEYSPQGWREVIAARADQVIFRKPNNHGYDYYFEYFPINEFERIRHYKLKGAGYEKARNLCKQIGMTPEHAWRVLESSARRLDIFRKGEMTWHGVKFTKYDFY